MADAYYRLKKYRESISYYKDFISSPASNSFSEKVDAYYNMGYAYKNREEFTRASENFRIYIQSNLMMSINLWMLVSGYETYFILIRKMPWLLNFMKKPCPIIQL